MALSPQKILIVSGGTGRTGKHVVDAALAQFVDPNVTVESRTQVRSEQEVHAIIAEAERENAVICHTVVDPELHALLVREAEQRGLLAFNPLAPMITLLGDRLGIPPQNKSGLHYELRKEQFNRIDAVDFTIAHDDGRRAEELDQADVVLAGVSRVAKSVVCFFLACRGIRAANVPLIPGVAAPPTLLSLDPRKVIGLTMNAQRLQSIRQERLRTMGRSEVYVDIKQIMEELRFANHLISVSGWHRIDVSYKAVEEITSEIQEFLAEQETSKTSV